MKTLQHDRRSAIVALASLVAAGRGLAADAARGEPAGPDRFHALSQPALRVRAPARSVLLAAAPAGQRIVAVGERGLIALSDDGGVTWRQARQVPVSTTLTAVRFTDPENGLAVGHGGVILSTRNGGEDWQLKADGRTLALSAKAAAQARQAAGDPRAPHLLKEAELLVQDGPDKPLLDVIHDGNGRAIVIGAYNLIFESTDGGVSWKSAQDRLDNPRAKHLYALRAHGPTWLLAGEQGLLLRSVDGGRTFSPLRVPYEGSWFALAVTAQGEWVVAGLRGNVFYSADAGQSWKQIEGVPPVSIVSATAAPDGSVLLANQSGELFSTRSGAPALPLGLPPLPPLSQALMMASGEILAVGMGGAIRVGSKKP
ncbi:photosystem II stability/assembly factor-like uncharacterized protein [Hydrogenophaga palleronii]|uniref:Photosystem II stability/assembly factor-like uncharacterized protein n=1 Tax=Hydrogenophaga palleronii TaxID=65655 RepID=A0ABU1WSZ1_9BURK|nr:YCF48-related protein [Hydrogenophaga palleronii]MDR7152027.1 photosystem II stability/assembly factor-like uncharacterized protein [Hydrogenophaga palleronii]